MHSPSASFAVVRFGPSARRARALSCLAAVLAALAFVDAARAQLPPDNIYREDTFFEVLLTALNRRIIQKGYDPYNRSTIPDDIIRVSILEVVDDVRDKVREMDSFIRFLEKVPDTRDASAQDITALNPTPNEHSFTIVGYGQAAVGFNFRPLIASGQMSINAPPVTVNLTPQIPTGFPANTTDVFLTGIAANGSVAAGYYRTSPTSGVPFFMPLPGVAPTMLPLAAGDLRAQPSRITPDGGFIVGTSFQAGTDPTVVNNDSRIIRWTRSGATYTAASIGGFPGAFRTIANAISANGAAIVGSYFNPQRIIRPLSWTQAAGFQDLGLLPGQSAATAQGQAMGTNNDGSVIVGTSGAAFRWDAANGMVALRTLQGSGVSTANAITPNGMFIGGTSFDGGFANGIAQLWTRSGETMKFRDLLFIQGVNVAGWEFNSIDRIVTSSVGTYTFLGNGKFNGTGTGFAFNWRIPPGPRPVILSQPRPQVTIAGGAAAFSVESDLPGAYQWQRNGTNIPGATRSSLSLSGVQPADAGLYTVVITNLNGSATSEPAALVVAPAVSRLANVSVRTTAGTGAGTLIVGFTTAGGTKDVLLRAIGPGLAPFGVPGTLADPRLALFNAGGAQIAQNDDWGGGAALTGAFDAAGAFRLPAASRDAALLSSLALGGYTAQVSGAAGTSGLVLLEGYDSDIGSPLARYTNLSARTHVGTGGDILILGFTVTGNAPKPLLIRAVGPGLAPFGVAGVLADPLLTIYNAGGGQVDRNDDWGGGAALANTFASLGAFVLPAASKDAALSVTLPPGSYTAQVSGVNNTTGVALAEIYEAPPPP